MPRPNSIVGAAILAGTSLISIFATAQTQSAPTQNTAQLTYIKHDSLAMRDLERRYGKVLTTLPTATGGRAAANGFESLPAGMLHATRTVAGKLVRYPLCLSIPGSAGQAKLGMATLSDEPQARLICRVSGGESGLFWLMSAKSGQNVSWVGASAQTPEPRTALVAATRDVEPLRPCASSSTSDAKAGQINAQGKCETNGGALSTYLVPVTQASGAGAKPFQGWAPASAAYLPHGAITLEEPSHIGASAVVGARPKAMPCRANINNVSWPGWVEASKCRAFSYENNATKSQLVSSFAVYRSAAFNQASAPPYAFNQRGGKAFYACVARDDAGKALWGFTNNPSACTNGAKTSTKNVTLLRLPATQGDQA